MYDDIDDVTDGLGFIFARKSRDDIFSVTAGYCSYSGIFIFVDQLLCDGLNRIGDTKLKLFRTCGGEKTQYIY